MGWEYQTVQFNFDAATFISQGGLFDSQQFCSELNRLGWEGWELVSVFDTNNVQGKRDLSSEYLSAR
jgi:Domain of unknown function (DUF4177)